MSSATADVVICGAGIAGISAAYHLAVKCGVRNVVVGDERPPLSLISANSAECYRNWWPGPDDAMVSLMNRSIDLLEELARETGNLINLNRRGYLYVTADPARIPAFQQAAQEAAELGAGPVRIHARSDFSDLGGLDPSLGPYLPSPAEGFEDQPVGADLIVDPRLIREHFPYLSDRTVAVLHARRCGWFSGQQMGMYLLERAWEHGVRFLQARLECVNVRGGRIESVCLEGAHVPSIFATGQLVIAAGPFSRQAGRMIDVDPPIYTELHTKVAFADRLGLVPRDVPLLIWADPQVLPWSGEERAWLQESEETKWLLDTLPTGVHMRPEGHAESPITLIMWDYHTQASEAIFPPSFDPGYPEIALRGLSTMIPALEAYLGHLPKPAIDGGYYTRTRENRPLIGPLPVQGAFVLGALSGFGMMASAASGELLAAHLTGSPLPSYASAFMLERYQDPEYRRLLENWPTTGQL